MSNGDKPASEMTKRESFAKAAMQGIIQTKYYLTITGKQNHKAIVRTALAIADAMLKEAEHAE